MKVAKPASRFGLNTAEGIYYYSTGNSLAGHMSMANAIISGVSMLTLVGDTAKIERFGLKAAFGGVEGIVKTGLKRGAVQYGAAALGYGVGRLGWGERGGQVGWMLGSLGGSLANVGLSIRDVRSADYTVSASLRGNPRAIYRGYGELGTGQRRLLAQLDAPGAQTMVRRGAVSQRDLAALTAATGDEFAMFTAGGHRLVVRGTSEGFHGIIDPAWAKSMAQRGWRFSGHTHPIPMGVDPGAVLMSSPGDRAILSVFGQQQSAILNSVGDRRLFNPEGDLLTGWKP